MTQVKLTKNELRMQQIKLQQLTRYLPTLQLKKAMLQQEVNAVLLQLEEAKKQFDDLKNAALYTAELFQKEGMKSFFDSLQIEKVELDIENIAGLDVPIFVDVKFAKVAYEGANVPLWWEYGLLQMKTLIKEKERLHTIERKKRLLEKELREVSIRVNLFEKVLIPRTVANIKKIKIFLSDLQLSAVAQAKVAKAKIESKRKTSIGAL
jgi:V/A-type H+-transporting ATPase subunit D